MLEVFRASPRTHHVLWQLPWAPRPIERRSSSLVEQLRSEQSPHRVGSRSEGSSARDRTRAGRIQDMRLVPSILSPKTSSTPEDAENQWN